MSTGTTTIINRTFRGTDDDTLRALRRVATRKQYPPQVRLCQQGAIEHTFYIVVEGNVAVSQQMEDGSERLLEIIGSNGYFGEMGLIDDSPRMASCITLTPSTVLEVTEEAFDTFVESSPSLAYLIMRRILSNARSVDQLNIADLRQKNADLQKAYTDLQAAQQKLIEKQRLEREMELAADVQRSLLPGDLPQYDDFAFAAYLHPARHVGGDFYDVIALDDEHVGILIADVADKGLHASLYMAVTRTLFLQESLLSLSPRQVALSVHRALFRVATRYDTFVTAFYGVLHRPSGRLTYVRAAQDRPLLYRPGAGIEALPGNGRFLGMLLDLTLQEYTVDLQPGDRLVLFSDGIPDAVNHADEPFENERLQQAILQHAQLPAADLAERLIATVSAWVNSAEPFDDMTLLVVEAKSV